MRCSVITCKSDSGLKIPGITFHSFPHNLDVQMKWIAACGRGDWVPKNTSMICSKHFDADHILKTGKLTSLHPNAVPIIKVEPAMEEPKMVISEVHSTPFNVTVVNVKSEPVQIKEEPDTNDQISIISNCNNIASLGKRGKPLRSQSQEIIYNVYKYFVIECNTFKKNEELNVNNYFKKVQERVAKATGISRRTLNNILNKVSIETHSTEFKFSTPKKGRPKKQFRLDMDDFDYDVVRRMVYDFHLRFNELPTVKSLQAKLLEAIKYNGSENTLRKILHEMGFRFTKIENNRKVLMEKHDVTFKRMEYLDKIRQFREIGKNIIYTAESYIHSSNPKGKSCDDKKNAQRLIIGHAGNEKGFVPGAFLTYNSTDTAGDYHSEMSNNNYEKWLVNQLIPNVPSDSVLVIDNAPHHNSYVERLPKSSSIKQDMINWLKRHEIPVDPKLTKSQIYAIICQHKERYTEFSVDKVLADHGHTVLRLPPHHPNFNPIENIWAQLKGYVASRNVGMDLATLKTLITEKVNMIGVEEWKQVCDHAIECENEYRRLQHDLDNYTDKLVIHAADSDSDIDLFESTDSEMEVIDS